MQLRSDSFYPYARLDISLAFTQYDPSTHVRMGGNRNPHLSLFGLGEVTFINQLYAVATLLFSNLNGFE